MLTPDDIRNPSRESGYNFVGRAGGAKKKPWRAQRNAGAAYGGPNTFRGAPRSTPLEAAQDFCDYANGIALAAADLARLKSAGHKRSQRPSQPVPAEVAAARGVLRDWKGQQDGRQGFVYLIAEDGLGGGLGAVKLGFSTKPEARVAELQTGNPRKLRLVAQMPGTEADERMLHTKYIEQNILQEWFRPTVPLLSEFPAIERSVAA